MTRRVTIMKVEIKWRNHEPRKQMEAAVSRRAERLERVVGSFNRGNTTLFVQIEYLPKRYIYQISASLKLAHQRLYVREEGHEPLTSIAKTLDELARKVRKLKSKFQSRRTETPHLADHAWPDDFGEQAEEEPPVAIPTIGRQQLSRLARMIHRELRYYSATHDFDVTQISPQSILDETIAAALPQIEEPGGPSIESILLREAMAAIHRRVQGLLDAVDRDDQSTEASVPSETKRDQLSAGGERHLAPLLEENLRFEDLLPVDGATPEEMAATYEAEEKVDEVLRALPSRTRNVFMLHVIEGMSMNQVAQTLKIQLESAGEHLTHALDMLRTDPELQEMLPRLKDPAAALS